MSEGDVLNSRREGPFERVVVAVNRWIVIVMMAVMTTLVFVNVVCRREPEG